MVASWVVVVSLSMVCEWNSYGWTLCQKPTYRCPVLRDPHREAIEGERDHTQLFYKHGIDVLLCAECVSG